MGTLYVDRVGLELRPEKGALVVYEQGRRRRTAPLALLERVVIHSDLQLSSRLIEQLWCAGIGLLCLNPHRLERAAFFPGRPHQDARIRLAQYAVQPHLHPDSDAAFALLWGRNLVRAKIQAQRRVLRQILALRAASQSSQALVWALRQLDEGWASMPVSVDSLQSLRGHEGAAARSYFSGLSSAFAPALGFLGRNRRPPRDPVNACLSLGYTLLHADAVRAAWRAGLDPLLGFYHAPAYGRESLACDLVEPLRPRLDFLVWQIFRREDLRSESFSRESDGCFLGKAGRRVFYEAFERAAPPWRRWLRALCFQISAALLRQAPVLPGRWEGEWEHEP